jgi:hypothetical protein
MVTGFRGLTGIGSGLTGIGFEPSARQAATPELSRGRGLAWCGRNSSETVSAHCIRRFGLLEHAEMPTKRGGWHDRFPQRGLPHKATGFPLPRRGPGTGRRHHFLWATNRQASLSARHRLGIGTGRLHGGWQAHRPRVYNGQTYPARSGRLSSVAKSAQEFHAARTVPVQLEHAVELAAEREQRPLQVPEAPAELL